MENSDTTSRVLPAQPSLEHLRSQAKDKLRDLRRQNPAAKLHQAQFELAREYGFASWPKLHEHVDALEVARMDRAEIIRRIEEGILQGVRAERSLRLLFKRQELISEELTCALIGLNLSAVQRLLDPADLEKPMGTIGAKPVAYVTLSPLAPSRPDEMTKLLAWFLDQGVDPNTTFVHPDFPNDPLSILYGASGVARSPEATRMLLDKGANPKDNESVYHACETRDHRCLKMLLEAGAYNPGSNEFVRMLDFEDMEGLELFLSFGPDLHNPNALIHAMRRGRSHAILERLLLAGADPNRKDAAGVSAAGMAFERGMTLTGAAYDPTPEDQLVAACWRGNVESATAFRSAYANLPKLRKKSFADACWAGRAECVGAFLAGGFTFDDRDDSGGSPLHGAAFVGSVPTVKALLAHGAPMDDRSKMYNATPLMWCMHASAYSHEPNPNLAATAQALIEAGSPPPDGVYGSEDVQEVLRARWPDLPDRE